MPPKPRRLRLPTPPQPRHRLPVRQRGFWIGAGVGLIISAALVTSTVVRRSSTSGTWGAHTAQLRERLRALDLPALGAEGTTLHTHQHLDVYVDGKRVTVPAGIGVGPDGSFYAPLHTHDESGIVHVESPTVRTYTLGQFAGVWGIRLTRRCIDGHCGGNGRTLAAFVDGKRVRGDPAQIELRPHAEILLAFGSGRQLPAVPSSYDFARGL